MTNGMGIYNWVTGVGELNGWMGPGRPIAPAAQATAGRRWDFPISLNTRYGPKAGEGITFDELRVFADLYDLLRLVIETRKDEMDFLEWKVQDRKGKETKASERMQEFLASPDGEHTWHQWQRMLLEEMFVTDAPAIYVRKTMGGDPYALEIVDGGTIKRLVDASGRTPMEGPAYQQVLHGIVAADYDRTELIYCPRNLRVNKVYGYSPVEQIITTVNIALRRQAHQLSYYTEGSVPDLLFQVPEGWDAKQIMEFQTWWASLFAEGNIANRRMARFVPHGVTPYNTKEAALKDLYDEWLARIICFAFSISPQALVAQVNRATAEVAQETAQTSGMEPIKNWLKGVMDRILAEVYGEPGLEFVWVQSESIDPEAQARIHATYIQCGVMSQAEVREAIGLDALKAPAAAGAQSGPGAFGQAGAGGWMGQGAQAGTGANVAPGMGAAATGAGAAVQDTALNGAQVASLVQIIESVNAGILPKDSAMALIMAAFPSLTEERVRGIIGPLSAGAGPASAPPSPADRTPAPMAKAGPMVPIDRGRASLQAPAGDLEEALAKALAGARDAAADYFRTPRVGGLLRGAIDAGGAVGCGSATPSAVGCGSATPSAVGCGSATPSAAGDGADKLAKGEVDWDAILGGLDLDFDPWLDDIGDALYRIAKDGGAAGLDQIRDRLQAAQGAARDQLVDQVNQRAAAWAEARAAELIKDIGETTRRGVASTVAAGIEEGLSIDELAARIYDGDVFDAARAQLIAHTELAYGDVAGNKMAYAASGVVKGLQWQAANSGGDERTCGACEQNHGAVVPLGEDGSAARPYPSGATGVPAHPRCLCDEFPYLGEV